MGSRKFILASKSPRRVEILKNIGVDFDIIPSDVDEDIPLDGTIVEYVEKLAKLKGEDIGSKVSGSVIISSDTIVVLDGRILTKPLDREDGFNTLKLLSGRIHHVYTSVSIIDQVGGRSIVDHIKTAVQFKDLSDNEIDWYLDTGEPFDKAGSYGIQGKGARFVKRIDGCFFSVMGFPVEKFVEMMDSIGIKI